MYYSLLTLYSRSRQVQREIAAPYEMHRTLLNAFPTGRVGVERADSEAADVLFRLDDHADGVLTVLVQSRTEPDWSALKPGYLLEAPQVKQREVSLQMDQPLTFRLRANPTKRLSAGKGNTGKRVGIYDEEGQLAWLARKGEQHGFRVLQAQVSRDDKIKNDEAIHREDGVHKLELLSVQFDGVLQVTDPDKLIRAVQTGIGSAKGFGFGLLSLAPVPK
ncbi:MAG: type I-E CRISPR-associated protein Cas6/Cse3/CasE [Chloroflexi bacterium]|nr:type I-E CRISPR-associated protein Cas6/Cse3/CasE [Chloroflexota bacterium]